MHKVFFFSYKRKINLSDLNSTAFCIIKFIRSRIQMLINYIFVFFSNKKKNNYHKKRKSWKCFPNLPIFYYFFFFVLFENKTVIKNRKFKNRSNVFICQNRMKFWILYEFCGIWPDSKQQSVGKYNEEYIFIYCDTKWSHNVVYLKFLL